MAERSSSHGLGPRLDLQQLQFEAQHRWLRPAEICEILRNYRMFHITSEPPNRPPSGSLFLFDRKVLRYFRKDGHNWRKKKDGKTVKEAHEKLKVGSVDVLHCYYAHGEENENFQRRSYWMLEPDMMHIVFVHYLDVKVNKTNIGRNIDTDEAMSESQKGSSVSSGFPTSYNSMPSRSTDSMSPTSTLTSLCEDADSEDIRQASSGMHSFGNSLGSGQPMDSIDTCSNRSYFMHPISGDHGQSTISVTDYIPHVQGDKSRLGITAYIEDRKSHVMPLRDTITEQSVGLYTPCSSISSGSMGSTLEQEKAVPENLFGSKSGLNEESRGSQSTQSNWQVLTPSYMQSSDKIALPLVSNCSSQITFDENAGPLPRWSLAESLGLEFESDYSMALFGGETDNAIPEICPDLFTSNGELKEQPVQQKFSKQSTDAQSQHAPRSDSEYELPREDSAGYSLTAKHALMDGEENLKKVDSFSRWITKELAEVDDLHLQSSPGISWSTDECGHVIDDTSLNPSLCQDQLFSINDFSPKWAYADSEIEVLIIGAFLKSQLEVEACHWSCMFGEVEVPAEILANGIMCCQAPPHQVGRVPFYVTCSNRFACSEVREFEFREGFARNVDFADFFYSSTEMMLHLRLDELLSSKSVLSTNKDFEGYMETRNLIFKLISLKEEEEYSHKEEATAGLSVSQHKLEEHVFHRKIKEKLYSWLLHKVTEGGKGPNVLDKDGQGVLHLVAALGYDWAITPVITAGVNINFRDVNGWTALHWAASCGRERTVAVLVSMGAAAGALTDPSPAFPSGRTAADLASSNGHKGISGFLGESLLTSHLASLTTDDPSEDGRNKTSAGKAVQTASERSATPLLYGDVSDTLCLKDSLSAVRNATQAADRIHQVFRMQSFQRKQLAQCEDDDEFGLSDQQVLSFIASRACKSGQGEGLVNAAAIQIQKKFRGWKKRKEFLIIRQRVVKIQAHVRGHQVRKQYKLIWSVGILEKVILRWRRKGRGLRGFRPDTLNMVPNPPSNPSQEDDYDVLKEGRKQSEERFQKALSRVKSMVQYPEARAQYRRVLNVVEDFRQTKEYTNSEDTVDGVADLIDIDMLLDDENFLPIAYD